MACFVLLTVVVASVVPRASFGCPAPGATDEQILSADPHLRHLYARYSEGGSIGRSVITPEGMERLVRNLQGRSRHPDHEHRAGDDHVTHDHHPHDHKGSVGLGAHDSVHSSDDPTLSDDVAGPHDDHEKSSRLDDDHSHAHDHADDTHNHHDLSNHHHKEGSSLAGSNHHRRNAAVTTTPPPPPTRTQHAQHPRPNPRTLSSAERNSASRRPPPPPPPPIPTTTTAAAAALPASESHVKCEDLKELIIHAGTSVRDFVTLCPTLVNYLDECSMDYHSDPQDHGSHGHTHGHSRHKEDFTTESWIGAVTSMVVIGVMGLGCIMLIPALKRGQHYEQVSQFLIALAVGTLAGDALVHLLPHAITMEVPEGSNAHVLHSLYGFTALGGIIMFLFLERFHNMFCGHGHSHSHNHELAGDFSKSKEEVDKETVVTATTIEDTGSQNIDKIAMDAQNCFEGCSSSPSSDANGNTGNGLERGRFADDETASPHEDTEIPGVGAEKGTEKKLASHAAERERLVTTPAEKSELGGGELSLILDTQAASVRPKVIRQNSSSFNMVLQEYHVGHHGHSHHGHSHVTGRKDSLRAMILMGDALHTFLDGMAIGAAFGTSITGGVATSIAVLCHELPHKVGDFALLFEMGMGLVQALKMMAMLWLFSLLGVIMGVLLGSIPTASPWIYSFTAGVFIYLALVDLLSELSVNRGGHFGAASQMFLQGLGMFTGAIIMLFIAIYEHDIEDLINGTF